MKKAFALGLSIFVSVCIALATPAAAGEKMTKVWFKFLSDNQKFIPNYKDWGKLKTLMNKHDKIQAHFEKQKTRKEHMLNYLEDRYTAAENYTKGFKKELVDAWPGSEGAGKQIDAYLKLAKGDFGRGYNESETSLIKASTKEAFTMSGAFESTWLEMVCKNGWTVKKDKEKKKLTKAEKKAIKAQKKLRKALRKKCTKDINIPWKIIDAALDKMYEIDRDIMSASSARGLAYTKMNNKCYSLIKKIKDKETQELLEENWQELLANWYNE